MGSIYKITNTVNGKAYIGQTIHDPEKTRIPVHLNHKSRGNRLLKKAVAKYGCDAFVVEILHNGIIPEFLSDLERDTIAKFKTLAPNGYNLTTGGEGGSPCEKTRQRLSKASKGRKHTPETRRKISAAKKGKPPPNKGHTHSIETRRKISWANTGKIHTKTSRRKMSAAKKGKPNLNGRSPHHAPARKVFFSFSDSLTLKEKRKHLLTTFPDVKRGTLYKWIRKWQSEL